MRTSIFRACLFGAIALLAACTQQARRPQPAPVVEQSKPTAATTPVVEQPAPTPAPKAKPKPKPVTPKPDVKDTDVAPAPETASALEGIERSQVGYYFDTLQGRLRQLVDPAIVVTHTDGHITVDVSRRVHFESDDSTLPAAECSALTPIAKALVEYKMTRIVADVSATGADDAALKSAKTRAAAITQCLADAGVAPKRLSSRQVAMATPEPRTILRIEPIVK